MSSMTIEKARRVAASPSRTIHALGRLLDASYLDEAPADSQREAWRESAAGARREYDGRRAALAAALAEVDRLTADLTKWREENCSLGEEIAASRDANARLAAEVDRLRSLPVIPTCGDCCSSGIDDRTEGEVCKHDLASDDVDFYPAVAMTAPPPEWCPLKARR
jgi:hypothetical protein